MFEDHSSSQDDNIHGLFKKIEYQGQIEQSQDADLDDSSQEVRDQHRKSYSQKISELRAQPNQSKNKLIKKNSVSAKMSRQRKKIYIDLLQQKADALKNQISKIVEQISRQKDGTMKIIRQSNPEKGNYIQQKISQSKRMVRLLEQHEQLHAQNTKQASSGKQINQNQNHFNQFPINNKNKPIETLVNLHTQNQEKANSEKQKLESLHRQAIIDQLNSPKIKKQQHEKKTQAYINSFSYKFGFKGYLKSAVFQLQKQRWYELLIDQKSLQSNQKRQQLQININNFKKCLNDLDRSSQRMEYLQHKIWAKVNNGSICKLLLDKKFFTQIAIQQGQQKNQF